MDLLTLTDHFRHFLTQRPAISPGRLAGELEMDRSNLQKIIEGKREIPQARRGDFRRVMQKYGYVVEDFSDHDGPVARDKQD